MKNQKHYRYVMTLKKAMWPRKIADALMNGDFAQTLVSVEDLQNCTHMYGSTYIIAGDNTQPHSKDAYIVALSRNEVRYVASLCERELQDNKEHCEQGARWQPSFARYMHELGTLLEKIDTLQR